MRAIKNTKIAFGLVQVGVRVYNATETTSITFNTFHKACTKGAGAVGNKRYCKCCDHTLASDEIIKGKEVDGKVVTVSDDELDALQDKRGMSVIQVEQFCKAEEIDAIRLDGAYYLEPTESGGEGYALLRQVMVESGLVAVVKFVLRTRQTLGVIRAIDNVMVMHTMCWPGEIRDTSSLRRLNTEISDQRLVGMAHNVVASLTEPFNPDAYRDEYTEAVTGLVNAKAEGKIIDLNSEAPEDVSDLIAALEASVARHPSKRTSRRSVVMVGDKPAKPAVKRPTRKAS